MKTNLENNFLCNDKADAYFFTEISSLIWQNGTFIFSNIRIFC